MEARPSLREDGELVHLLDRLPEAALILLDDGTIGYANPAAGSLLGVTSNQAMQGRRLASFVAPEDRRDLEALLADLEASGQPLGPELVILSDDERLHVELSALPVTYDGRPAVLAFLDDVTHHRRIEASLRDTVSLHRATLGSTSEGILVIDAEEQRITSYNDRFQEIWRLPDEALEDLDPAVALEHALELVQDPEAFRAKVEAIYEDPQRLVSETVELTDGRVLDWRSQPRQRGDEVVGRVSTFRDITGHRQAHEELERALALNRATFEATPHGLLVIDSDGRVVQANERFYEMWGIPDRIRAHGDDEVLLSFAAAKLEDPDRFLERVELLYEDPEAESFDTLRFEDGRVFERHSLPQRVGDEIVGRVWSFKDISDRKRIERQLRETVSLHRATIEATADGVVVVDLEGGLRTYNDQFCEMWGFEAGELDQMTVDDALDRILDLVVDPGIFEAHVEHLFENPEIEDTLTVRLTDGRVFERYSKPQRIDGEIVGRVVTFRDVTGWRRAEQDLQRRVRRSNLRAQVSEALTRTLPDYRDGLDQVATAIAETLGGGCTIRLLGQDQQTLEPLAYHHPDPALRQRLGTLAEGTVHRSGQTLTGQVQASGEGFLISELEPGELSEDLPDGYQAYFDQAQVHTLLMVPIRAQDQSIGVISVDRSTDQDPLTPDDLQLLQDLADRVGLVILNARLFEEIQEELSRRQSAEAALRKSERAFRSLYENAPVGIYRTTPDGEVLLANPALREMLGLDGSEDLADRNLGDRFEPAYDREAWKNKLEVEGEIRGLESTWTLSDGTEIHVRESARVVHGEDDEVAYYEGTVEDISARVQIEEALREQRDLYASLLRAQSDLNEGMLICDASSGQVIYANDAYSRITGFSDEDLAEMGSFLDIVVAEERDRLLSTFTEEAEEGDLHDHFTTRIDHKDGSQRWVEGSITQMESRGADLLIALVRDITDRKVAKAELEETADRLAEAQRVAKLGSWDFHADEQASYWSPQTYEIFGMEPTDGPVPLEEIRARIHPDDRVLTRKMLARAVEAGDPYDADIRVVHPDEEVRWIHAQGERVIDPDGRVRVVGTLHDITERKEAEEQVRRLNEELEARVEERTRQLKLANQELEAFSYSVSHDLQAPLQTINGFTKIVLDEHAGDLDEDARFLLERVRAASRSMDNLIRALLDLSRVTRQEIDRRPVDLTALAQEVTTRLEERDPGREVTVTIQEGLEAEGDPRLLEVLLENLLSNAWKFTREVEDPAIEVGATEEEHGTVFHVRDNGVGFDMDHADQLFTPFQRLHAEGFEGTGIGLATVQRIVARHGGTVDARGEVNEGATFRFTLAAS